MPLPQSRVSGIEGGTIPNLQLSDDRSTSSAAATNEGKTIRLYSALLMPLAALILRNGSLDQ